MKECMVCKTTFTHGRKDKRICSLECKRAHVREYKKKFNKNLICNCVVCNKEFVKRTTSITCSKTCSKERERIRNAKWRKENAETLAIKKSEYQKKNRVMITEHKKKWRETRRPPKIDIQCKECKEQFTPTTRAKHITFCSRKCQFNNWHKQPKNKLNWAVQDAVRRGMKGIIHKSKYFEGLSFTMEELRTHLENQFEDWMNWNNHGLWHIDHIRPVASFDFTSMEDEDFKKCWALENLQPLKDTENMRKNHYLRKTWNGITNA